ncbi:SGNH/GDSL hydrolase family protein [Luteibacter aegosomatissinici]|uniref:SGNH/GDSL hydrolase family protein n=1 Tax=Luteibacter aegosomatissinici TaxID=2911539 RepID=UPI001FF89AD2|nr:SGNH/GDSL hydrolase family protein [Luteibacter aegosomatissinici]UPG93316.1 SGNH/GDSL hydrolase family protein [Luteibacter aegosomatissinici]
MPRKVVSRASALLQVLLATCLMALACASHAAERPRRILFVGNSLTYVNNLPGATASLAPAGVAVDAFALPGASLVDDEHNARLADLLTKGRYTDVIFQERGGNAVCMGQGCMESDDFRATERASKALADAARVGGARVYYLGTYQGNPAIVPLLIAGEQRIARQMGARYIEIGRTWLSFRRAEPAGAWLHSDGQHPGYATTALMAIRVWQAVSGETAHAVPCVGGTLYYQSPSEDGFFRVDRAATPVTCLVSSAQAELMGASPLPPGA